MGIAVDTLVFALARGLTVTALTACLLEYGEVGLWLKKQRVMANSWDGYGGDLC